MLTKLLLLEDTDLILDNIRKNSILLSTYYKKQYYELKEQIKYFRLPTIILSAVNSVFSVGLQPYIEQKTISLTNCFVSLLCGVLVSIEMFLNIENNMRQCLESSKDFYLLSVDIQKYLLLDKDHRKIDNLIFLDKIYNLYIKLYEKSTLLKKNIKDELTDINISPNSSNCSTPSNEKYDDHNTV